MFSATSQESTGCQGRGLIAEQAELCRQAVLMGCDVGVDTACIGFEKTLLIFGHGGRQALRRGPDLQHPLHLIVLHHPRSQQLGELAGGKAARHIHLPQTVLGHNKALRFEQVVHGCRLDMGYATGVPPYQHRGGEPRQLQFAVEHRQLLAHGFLEPHYARGSSHTRPQSIGR